MSRDVAILVAGAGLALGALLIRRLRREPAVAGPPPVPVSPREAEPLDETFANAPAGERS